MYDYEVHIEQHEHLMDTELGNYTKEDVVCLVENMYFEARSDGYAGMYAYYGCYESCNIKGNPIQFVV